MLGHFAVLILMIFEAGILTGYCFLDGFLANMSLDKWVPIQFGNLKSIWLNKME